MRQIFLVIMILFINKTLFSQRIEFIKNPEIYIDEQKNYFNPIVEPETSMGAYQVLDGYNQTLFLFSLEKKLGKTEVNLIESSKPGIINIKTKKVSLAPSFQKDEYDGIVYSKLYFMKINKQGRYEINSLEPGGAVETEPIDRPESHLSANYPIVVSKNNKVLSFVTIEKNIKYSYDMNAFKAVRDVQVVPGAQDIGPIISPDKKYLAFTRLYSSKNSSSIVIKEIIIKNEKVSFKGMTEFISVSGVHNVAPSFSPDSRKIAWYSNKKNGGEIYSIYAADVKRNAKPIVVAQQAFRKTMMNRGPTWLDNDVIVFVKHAQDENYPIYFTSVSSRKEKRIITNTIMNKDIFAWKKKGSSNIYNLIYVSLGKSGSSDIMWNKIYRAQIKLIK